ncbi:MAG: DUF1194 domain-containing protein [Alphaproteobacteria bacterium]|nr:DUF1194 domain-containing protein [Alphaproteobacteria bacterium]
MNVRNPWICRIPAAPLRQRSGDRPGGRSIPLLFGALMFVGSLLLITPYAARAAERAVDLELVLAADISDSMDLAEANLQRAGIIGAIRHPLVIRAIQRGQLGRIAVSYVEWAGAGHQRTIVGWAEISDAASAAAFAAAIQGQSLNTAIWTSISTAIEFAARGFEGNGYTGQRRIIDISGDGPNNHGNHVVFARDRAIGAGITINGLAIVNDRLSPYGFPPLPDLDLYYQDCVIGGPGAFLVIADGFADFARAIRRKLLLEIAGAVAPAPLLWRATARARPPCDAGEQQLRGWNADVDWGARAPFRQ